MGFRWQNSNGLLLIGMNKSQFPSLITKPVTNFLTKEQYMLFGGKDISFSEADIRKITEICSQRKIYDVLFNQRLNGTAYTQKNAEAFVNWIQEGWNANTHFVFFVRKQTGEIIGALDIKSATLAKAYVGYWADENYRGFMTNALIALITIAQQAGYICLGARVLHDNYASIAVLERAGFKKISVDDHEDGEQQFEYELML